MATAQPIDVVLQKSGIASILSLSHLTDARLVHDYLKAQGCTVGEIFEVPGEFSFFAYSIKHPVRETIAQNGHYRLTERPDDVE
ncbi:MAG TPA: hypothetical protein VG826_26045 [Pirellulales bacterium]|nr:hypothetical protein [Pirellulales bacterium]